MLLRRDHGRVLLVRRAGDTYADGDLHDEPATPKLAVDETEGKRS